MRTDETKNLSDVSNDVFEYALTPYVDNKTLVHLAHSDPSIFSLVKHEVAARVMQALLQAVIDDQRDKVKDILKYRPELLLQNPNDMKVYGAPLNIIESRYTWQKFYTEPPLVMALKRNQVKMVKIILPYFEKLKDGTQKAVEQWESAEGALAKRDKRFKEEDKYSSLIKKLIPVIAEETFPNGTKGERSQKTEDALNQFRQTVLPDKAIALNDFDIKQVLETTYKVYNEKFDVLQSWDQRDVFCINVIGFIQSLLSPEDGKVFCEGLYNVVAERKEISDRTAGLRLTGGESFYRDDRLSAGGMGFTYFCRPEGYAGNASDGDRTRIMTWACWSVFKGRRAAGWLALRQLRTQLLQPSEPTKDSLNCVLL